MNDPRNPYAPPVAPVTDREDPRDPDGGGRFIPYGRTRPAGQGAAWIGDAWRLLRAQPGMWAALLVLEFVAYIVLSAIPLLSLFVQFVTPFAYAAIALAGDQQRRTGTFDLKVIGDAFSRRPAPLLAVGGVVFLAAAVFGVVLAVFLGTGMLGVWAGSAQADPAVVMLPVGLATYLAPQLIVLHDQPALEAMKMSFVGTLKNFVPGLVFGLCAFGLLFVSMIPLFLGLLITVPVLAITAYTVYRDIFVEDEP
jgi:uncharacterized membrane protein